MEISTYTQKFEPCIHLYYIYIILTLNYSAARHWQMRFFFLKEWVQSKPLRMMFHKSNYTSYISWQQWSKKTRLPSTACHKQLRAHCKNQHGGSNSCHTLCTVNNMCLYYKQPANHMQTCTIMVTLQSACSSGLLWIMVAICVRSRIPVYRFFHQTQKKKFKYKNYKNYPVILTEW